MISLIFVRGISFFTTPVFTRLMSTEQYGILTVYESWLRIAFPILTLSLYASAERAKYEFEEDYDKYLSSIQAFMFLLSAVWSVITLILHKQIGKLLNMTDMMLVIMLLYVAAQSAINNAQRREKVLLRYKQNILLTLFGTVVPTVISIGLLSYFKYHGYSEELLQVRILSFYIPQIIVGIFVGGLILYRGKGCLKKSYMKYAVKFSFPLIPHMLSMEILSQSDKIMVSRLTGDANAGIFSLATNVMWIALLLSQAVGDAWIPWFYEKLQEKSYDAIQKVWKTMICLFGVFCWLIVMFAPEIIFILGGEKYKDAVYLVAPMIIGVMAHFFSYSYISIEQFFQKTYYVMAVSMVTVILNLILNYTCINQFGYIAAAFTTAVSYLLMIVLHALILKWKYNRTFISAKDTLLVLCFFAMADFVAEASYALPFYVRWLAAGIIMLLCFAAAYKKWKEFKIIEKRKNR